VKWFGFACCALFLSSLHLNARGIGEAAPPTASTARHHKGILRQTPGYIGFEHRIDPAAYWVNDFDSFRRYKYFQRRRHRLTDQDIDPIAREDSESTEQRAPADVDFRSPDLLSTRIFDNQ